MGAIAALSQLCLGQGRISVTNRTQRDGYNIDAPFTDELGNLITGDDYVLQLYVGTEPDFLVPVGPVGTFAGGRGPGLFKGYVVSIPFLFFYEYGWMQIRVWRVSEAATFEEAALLRKWTGVSNLVFAQARGFPGGVPELPGVLGGLAYPGQPLIVEQPNDVAVKQGQHVTFAVNAVGTTGTRYQWIDADSGKPIEGATNSVFTPSQITTSKRFQVKIENSAGVTLSRIATAFAGPLRPVLELRPIPGAMILRIHGSSGATYRLEYCDQRLGSPWTQILDFQLHDAPLEFLDPTSGTVDARFYRLTSAR
jgi:hypothetical protein